MSFNKIGFHFGSQASSGGWGPHVRALDAAGVPVVLMSMAGEGFGDIKAVWDAGSTVAHVVCIRYGGVQGNHDVPPYGTNARQAAVDWWNWYKPRIGSDAFQYKDRIVLKMGNELDKNQAEWLAGFYLELYDILQNDSDGPWRMAAFNYSAGEPEPAHWRGPIVEEYLRLCATDPAHAAIGLHEYSYQDVLDIGDLYQIGRFTDLFRACDELGIRRPNVYIHEFGWRQDTLPGVGEAMAQIPWAAELYASYPQIKGAGIWTLQGSGTYGNPHISSLVQPLIAPMTEYSLVARFPDPDPVEPPIEPPEPPVEPPPDGGIMEIVTNEQHIAGMRGWGGRNVKTFRLRFQHLVDGEANWTPWQLIELPDGLDLRGMEAHAVLEQVTEIEVDGESKPPVQYARVVHVIPPDASSETAAAAIVEATSARQTISYSYDDAGYAPGFESNTAVLWGIPEAKHQEFIDWFGERFPNTAVTFRDAPPKATSPLDGLELGQLFDVSYVQTSPFNAPRDYSGVGGPADAKHEGVDFDVVGTDPDSKAPVLCAYDGIVERSLDSTGGYGRYVRVAHGHNGATFYTRYCHLDERFVEVDQFIEAGESIGEIGTSGNVTGEHLHFNLEVPGFGLDGYVVADVVDPTPYLPAPLSKPPDPPSSTYHGPAVSFAPTIHQPGSDWMWNTPEIQGMMSYLDMPIKWLSDGINVDFWPQLNKPEFHLVRLNWKSSVYRTAAEAWSEIRDGALRFYNVGARKFEFLNETNLPVEGFGILWNNGDEFGRYLADLMALARVEMPDAQFYFPGMSPGVPWTNQFQFTDDAWPHVAEQCYGACLHAYTGIVDNVDAAVADIVNQVVEAQAYKWLDRPLVVSECSVNRAPEGVPDDEISAYKAAVYRGVEEALAQVPGIEAVVWFVSHWQPPAEQEAHKESWLDLGLAEAYKGA